MSSEGNDTSVYNMVVARNLKDCSNEVAPTIWRGMIKGLTPAHPA